MVSNGHDRPAAIDVEVTFLQADPLALAAGLNFYAYVDSDPLNAYDPYGLSALQAVTDAAHVALTVASFCPSLCGSLAGGIDAAIYAAQGQYTQAAISGGAAVAGLVASSGAIKVAAIAGIAATDALKLTSAVGRNSAIGASSIVGAGGEVFGAGRIHLPTHLPFASLLISDPVAPVPPRSKSVGLALIGVEFISLFSPDPPGALCDSVQV